jgi:hypothetical protein
MAQVLALVCLPLLAPTLFDAPRLPEPLWSALIQRDLPFSNDFGLSQAICDLLLGL